MIESLCSASTANSIIIAIGLAFAYCIVVTLAHCFKAFVAFQLGDPTPIENNFLSLNPIDHVDPIGAFCLLFFGLGWGKSVPINTLNIHGYSRNLKIVLAYMSDIIAYIGIGIICMLFLVVLFDKNIIATSLHLLMCKGLGYQSLHMMYPLHSSISISIGFIAICALYLSITIGTIQCIIDGFHLGILYVYADNSETNMVLEVILFLLPLFAMILLSGPLRYLIIKSIATVSIFLTGLIGL
jgi:hypothetical protein